MYLPGNVLPSTSLGEEGVKGIIPSPDGLVRGHLAVGLDAMFQAVELPAGIAHLAASLANVDGDAFTLGKKRKKTVSKKVSPQYRCF